MCRLCADCVWEGAEAHASRKRTHSVMAGAYRDVVEGIRIQYLDSEEGQGQEGEENGSQTPRRCRGSAAGSSKPRRYDGASVLCVCCVCVCVCTDCVWSGSRSGSAAPASPRPRRYDSVLCVCVLCVH